MRKKEKAYLLLSKLEEMYLNAQTELQNWSTPFQFLICIMLSAQTTDKQVNKVTGRPLRYTPTGIRCRLHLLWKLRSLSLQLTTTILKQGIFRKCLRL